MNHAANAELLNAVNAAGTWFHAKKVRPIWARPVEADQVVETLEGRETVRAGEYLCRGEAGELWPQQADKLLGKYTATEMVDAQGWRKFEPRPDAAGVCAAQISHPFTIQTARGALHGKAGDYLVKHTADKDVAYPADVWIVAQQLFDATYERTGS